MDKWRDGTVAANWKSSGRVRDAEPERMGDIDWDETERDASLGALVFK